MNDFENIKRLNRIEDVIKLETGASLLKVGSSLGLNPCPFCGHKDSFRVQPAQQTFKCFSPSCGRSGDMFTFIGEKRGIADKYQILKATADLLNYQLENSRDIRQSSPMEKVKQVIFDKTAEFYNQLLLNDPVALKRLSDNRGFTKKTVEKFKIGYSGNEFNKLYKSLNKDYSDEDLIKSGLIKKRNGKPNDFFIPKLFIYPHYSGNKVVDFSIKDAYKADKKKEHVIDYRLPAEYRIGAIKLYNQDALFFKDFIIAEGREDAIQLMRFSERTNVCALTGNPNKADIELIKKYAVDKKVIFAFDADGGGDGYFKKFFLELWGVASSLQRLTWKGNAKDIDEHIRKELKTNKADAVKTLINDAPEALSLFIQSIPVIGDISHIVNELRPLVDKILLSNDIIQFDIALEYIKSHFEKGASIANIIGKQYKKAQLEQFNGKDYLKNLPFYEKDGVYYHKKSGGVINLSNFRLNINDRIFYDDQTYYRCDIHSVSGEYVENLEFSPAERVDSRKFRTKLAGAGAFHFTGKDNELSGIWQYEESKGENRHIHYVKQYGYIRKENMWLFDNCAIKDGQIYNRDKETDFIQIGKKHFLPHNVMVYSGTKPRISTNIEYKKRSIKYITTAFHQMLDSSPDGSLKTFAGYLFLGFIPATIYSNEIFAKLGYFPFLFSYGPPATGKTAATRLLLNAFGFMGQPESWDDASVAGTYQFVQQISSMPCWYDEFLNNKTFDRLLGTIKNIYNKTGGGKGGKEEIRTIREVNGTLWLSGEDNPSNEAVLSRSILFRFGNLNEHKNKAYNYLLKRTKEISVITRNLLLEKNEQSAIELIRRIEEYKDYIISKNEKIDPRVAGNYAIIAASLSMLDIDLPAEFDEYLLKHAEINISSKEGENPRLQFFEEIVYLYNKGQLRNSVRLDRENDRFYIHFNTAFKDVQRDMRSRGQAFLIKKNSVKDYLTDTPGFKSISDRTYFESDNGANQKRVMSFYYNKLPQSMKDLVDEIK